MFAVLQSSEVHWVNVDTKEIMKKSKKEGKK